MVIESESGKTCISAPAHPSATGIGRVSGLVNLYWALKLSNSTFMNHLLVLVVLVLVLVPVLVLFSCGHATL